ncbi:MULTISPECIES: helix-turn-helix domain-containing protein [Chryseobacterium]|uniref:helix-turn-helix domain-containing protein n=1 Tax=Chryseobacterium TaxID=59732 RepID=UPI0019593D46|nr:MULTISPECIES: helix-turn-helix domain-containing protein [Chryseobacterium]MBM7419228.1 transcriptional regulator with XRE-family HTH domain [Chryseobacterium sp. JUb44]MDH6209151.1 transcriptional regulator with XRE-family HTH domain [Chryseobacterium sp. BIGb0186]WSO12001.1 helix-turn-helix domain-containing protein [Chryseobacterium scophthalmum]
MKNKIQLLREKNRLTQKELAEKAGLSLRTIQRIEAGNIPKGFTLKALAESLNTTPENLIEKEDKNIERAKLINSSALFGLIIPFGGIIFPLIFTYKTQDVYNKQLGRNIVALQIILSVTMSLFLIASPFLQKGLSVKFPVFLIVLITFLFLKLLAIIINGIALNKNKDLHTNLKFNFL